MLQNNAARWNLWNQAGRPLDYEVFFDLCLEAQVAPFTLMEFATKVGMILVGASTFPEMEHPDAYQAIATGREANEARLRGLVGELQKSGKIPVMPSCCG